METETFHLTQLDKNVEVPDLDAVILGISGVGYVSTDLGTHTVLIEFDPNYVSKDFLAATMKGAGYVSNENAR